VRNRIYSAIERIRIRPEDHLERLTGSKYYKLRVGHYRVIIDLQRERIVIMIIDVGHRKNVYKGFIGG